MKRTFDIVCASLLLVVTLPLWPIFMLAVWISSPGPIFFTDRRVGQGAVAFSVYKFSTLYPGTHDPKRNVLPGDERVTVAGRFLRSTHLDELPQLFNILRGEMSLVGPRPLPLDFMEEFSDSPWYEKRLSVRPGLTGLAQLKGRMWWVGKGLPCVFRLDAYYVRHSCLLLDLNIILRTVGVVLRREGV